MTDTVSSGRTRRSKSIESDLIKPGEDWRNVPDSAERRKIQNRIAQRSYRRGMRARKNEIEDLKQQLQQYTSRRNDNKSVSPPPPHSNRKRATVDVSDKSQSPSSPRGSLRSSMGNAQNDVAVLTVNGQGTGSVFAGAPHSQTGSNGQLSPNNSIDLTTFHKPSDTRSHTLPIMYGDPNTIPPQSMSLTQHNHTTTQNAGSDQPWDATAWPWTPPRSDPPMEQHREPMTPSTPQCGSLIPTVQQPGSCAPILHLSVSSGNCDILNTLLQYDEIDIDEKDSAGFTPLQRAVMAGRADMVAVLLEHGADINGRD